MAKCLQNFHVSRKNTVSRAKFPRVAVTHGVSQSALKKIAIGPETFLFYLCRLRYWLYDPLRSYVQ